MAAPVGAGDCRPLSGRLFRPAGRGAILAAAAGLALAVRCCLDAARGPPESLAEGPYQVDRVIDGRTLLLANRAQVRLMGTAPPVDSDRPQPAGGDDAMGAGTAWERQGAEWLAREAAGREVRLEFDRERVDRRGRFLAYVWIGDRLLNEELIRAGLARWDARQRTFRAFRNRLRRAEQEAEAERRGLWSKGTGR
jgi:micrococcal nuclease